MDARRSTAITSRKNRGSSKSKTPGSTKSYRLTYRLSTASSTGIRVIYRQYRRVAAWEKWLNTWVKNRSKKGKANRDRKPYKRVSCPARWEVARGKKFLAKSLA